MMLSISSQTTQRHHKPRILSWRPTAFLVFLTACINLSFATTTIAEPLVAAEYLAIPAVTAAPEIGETLILDNRVPVFQDGHWAYLEQEQAPVELRRRTASTIMTTGSATATAAETIAVASESATSSPLPSAFDSSLGSNFTGNSCPTFFNDFLTNVNFKKCYPISLMLQGSSSFFNAEKSLVSITRVLDTSCRANVTFCTDYLTTLAENLTSSSNCGDDFKLGNSVVVQAYLGMVSYKELYSTTCLKDPTSSAYCFANAVTNLTTPSNVYLYYLPLNISLPGSSVPTCNWCTKQTMAVFQAAAADRSQPIANTYASAAQQVDTICGPDFVNDTLPASTSAANSLRLPSTPPLSWALPSILAFMAVQLFL